jgi:sec-independent protein translocase protein TatB
MFFDLSLPEIVVLLGLGVMLFGPEKLPHAAATAARFLQQVRAFSESTKEGLRKELGPEFDGLDLQDLNPKTFVRKNLLGETEDLRSLRDELNQDLRGALGTSHSPIPATAAATVTGVTTTTATAIHGRTATAERTVLAVGERPAFDEDAT